MGVARRRLAPPAGLGFCRRTARLRLTALLGGVFVLSGVALVAITYVLFEHATEYRPPHLPTIPHAPAIQHLQLASPPGNAFVPGPSAPVSGRSALGLASQEVGHAQLELKPKFGSRAYVGPLGQIQHQLTQAQHQLTRGQQELVEGQLRLANAVHQLAQEGHVQAAQRDADSHQLLINSGIALAVVAVLAVLAGWLVAGRMLRPIRTITRKARRISSTSLHERLALDGPEDELKELGDTLDDLFGRLDAAFDAQRHFVANAAHELRTPLTAERTLLQVALDDPDTTTAEWRSTANEVLASSDEQARLIEALLALASSESRLVGHEPVDLAAAIIATLAGLQPEIDRLGINIEVATAPAPLEGDPLLVERLVANLLGNAVRHNVVGGHVEVVTAVKEGQTVLSVTNTGPVIRAAEVDRLFEPFERLDRRRMHHKEGHGLGLSIVRAIATAHHASISAYPMPNGGLAVAVTFPQPANPQRVTATLSQDDEPSAEIEIAMP